jgi:hypothetical protein
MMARLISFIFFLSMITVVFTESTENGHCKDGKDEYCSKCENDKCTSCNYSYPDENGQCKEPTTKIENCVIYNSSSVCSTCKLGYHGTQCTAIAISNCGILSLTDILNCAFCDGLQEKDETSTCSGDACTIANCYTCKGTNETQTCSSCDEGYELSSDKKSCKERTGENAGCTSSSNCTQCRRGFYVSSSTSSSSSSLVSSTSVSTVKCTKSSRYESESMLKSLFIGTLILIKLF